MKIIKKTAAAVLVLAMLLSVLAGCGGESGKTYTDFPEKLTAKKIGSIDVDMITPGNGGLYYRDEDGKYGIMTADGKHDTGAIYTNCENVGRYFIVTTVSEDSIRSIKDYNCAGVVDAKGKEIVPMQYAHITKLNDRYLYVCEVLGTTDNEDDALLRLTDNTFSLTYQEGDTYLTGNWYVYDVTTGKKVEGVTGTKSFHVGAFGDVIEYWNDSKKSVRVNEKGESVSKEADLFENGYYALVQDNAGAVYDPDGKKIFDYALDGFIPFQSDDGYYVARKLDGSAKYVLMDQTGKTVSAEFSDRPQVYGDLVFVGDKLCDMNGKALIEGTFDHVYLDRQFKMSWLAENDSECVAIKKDGTVLCRVKKDSDISVNMYDGFLISKDLGSKKQFYCLADQDFTLAGQSWTPWMIVSEKVNDVSDLTDVISGKTVISGYTRYLHATVDSVYYVYARKVDGGVDIYTVE